MNKYKIQSKLFYYYALKAFLFLFFNDRKNHKKQERYQIKRVKKLVRKAYEYDIYKKKFDDAGINPYSIKSLDDLQRIPRLTKEEYRSWMNNELKSERSKFFNTTHTSGSTGIPTTNIFHPIEYAYHYIADFFCWFKGGYNPFFGKTLTRQPGDNSVGTKSFIQKLGILRRECFNTKWERCDIIKKINSYKPDFILCNSSELIYIAEWALAHNEKVFSPKYYCPNGENVDGLNYKILTSVFGKGLINVYGGSEMADFSVRKPGNDYYDVIDGLAVLQVLSDGKIKNSGTGSLLVTSLYREEFPLINYEIGDIVDLRKDESGTFIDKVNGRKNDVFIWADGTKTIYKNLENINSVLENIFQIRFIQTSETTVKFQVVKDKTSSKTTEELELYMSGLYQEQFGNNVKIEYEWLPVIPPDPNGKIRNMISLVNKDK